MAETDLLTLETRLAQLETKLAALTATTPTTYYTHQYSGEEIDAATGRALTGGALDTSVTNVSNQLGTFTRPNLLDNWYFGRPVDQRGGKIIQSGVNIYTDSALKTLIGPAAYACPVVELTSTYAKVRDAKNAGSYYYAAPADVVRGYTAPWAYAVDRWQTSGELQALLVEDHSIKLVGAADKDGYIFQRGELLRPGEYCFSILFGKNTDRVELTNWYVDRNLVSAVLSTEQAGILTLHFTTNEWIDANYAYFRIKTYGSCNIIAAKLELGPTQTLAHQDAAGNWMLNEVPEYGEQLRRCRWYCKVYKAGEYLPCIAFVLEDGWYCCAMLPYEMRAKPANNIGSNISVTLEPLLGGTGVETVLENYGTLDGVQILKFSKDGQAFKNASYYRIKLNADLILTADL